MTIMAHTIWKIINQKNEFNKSEIDYLIYDTKNRKEKKQLKKLKKIFTADISKIVILNDDILIKLIDSKVFLKFLLITLNNEIKNEYKQNALK